MPSASRSLGDPRQRVAAFATHLRKGTSSLQVQAAPNDGFADLFRLIANASPPPSAPTPRERTPSSNKRAEDEAAPVESGQDGSRPQGPAKASKDAAAQRADAVAAWNPWQASPGQRSSHERLKAKGDAAGDEGPDVDAAAGQQQWIVSAGTPQAGQDDPRAAAQPVVVDEAVAAAAGSAEKPLLSPSEQVTERSDALAKGAPPTAVGESLADGLAANANQAKGSEPPAEPLPEAAVAHPDVEASAEPTSEETRIEKPAAPLTTTKPSSLPGDANSEDAEETATNLSSEGGEEAGKRIFTSGENEHSEGRRHGRGDEDARFPDRPDANRIRSASPASETSGIRPESPTNPAMPDAPLAEASVEPATTADARSTGGFATAAPVLSTAAAPKMMGDGSKPLRPAPATSPIGATTPETDRASTAASQGPSGSNGPGVSDRVRLVQRVANAFQRLGVDGGQVRIRLHPADLGSVRLEMQIQGNRMNARVLTETESARGVLREHLPDLRQRLSDQGIQVERIEVELESDTPSNRDSAQQQTQSESFGQSSRRENHFAHPRRQPGPQREAKLGGDAGPADRSVTEAVLRPGVDLTF